MAIFSRLMPALHHDDHDDHHRKDFTSGRDDGTMHRRRRDRHSHHGHDGHHGHRW